MFPGMVSPKKAESAEPQPIATGRPVAKSISMFDEGEKDEDEDGLFQSKPAPPKTQVSPFLCHLLGNSK